MFDLKRASFYFNWHKTNKNTKKASLNTIFIYRLSRTREFLALSFLCLPIFDLPHVLQWLWVTQLHLAGPSSVPGREGEQRKKPLASPGSRSRQGGRLWRPGRSRASASWGFLCSCCQVGALELQSLILHMPSSCCCFCPGDPRQAGVLRQPAGCCRGIFTAF